MWKGLGLSWMASHPGIPYTPKYSLRERILRPIDEIRSEILIAISLAEKLDPAYGGEAAMGFDSTNEIDAIFAAGVFCRIAIIISYQIFESIIPSRFSIFHFSEEGSDACAAKLWFPKIGFRHDTEL